MSRFEPHVAEVCAVIVTWQADTSQVAALVQKLISQQCAVIVIDNGSENVAALRSEPVFVEPSVTLECWPENRGLAAALNAGLLMVRAQGYRFALLFDQDSDPANGFCRGMLRAWHEAKSLNSPVAAIGPRLLDPASGRKTPFRCFRFLYRTDAPVAPKLYETDFLITSGTLLSVSALAETGLMKENYFIDNIDLEWCFRARSKGFALYGTDHAVLYHRIGEVSNSPFVKAGLMVEHSPLRSYYSTRNRFHLRRQDYAPTDWKVRDAVRFFIKSMWLVLFTSRRADYLQQIRRGIRDAETLL